MTEKKERQLTDNQKAFLSALIPCKGNIREAMRVAGYADSVSVSEIIRSLRDEIKEVANDALSLNVVKASIELGDQIDNPTKAGAGNALKAANSILDRLGMTSKEEVRLNVPTGGLIIMPAKDKVNVPEVSDA